MSKLILILLVCISVLHANIGTVMVTKGDVKIKRVGELIAATNGMKLLEKDEIVTQSKSRAQVMLNDETVITIGPKSSFTFEEYAFDDTSNSKLTVKASRGFFRSVTGRIGKVAPERFKVKTASATIGIRGTDFSGDISVERELFKCYSGGISIAFEGGVQDVDAGMMMEISAQQIELKKISSKGDKTASLQTKKKKSTQALKDKKINNKTVKETVLKIVVPHIPQEIVSQTVERVEFSVGESLDIGDVTIEELETKLKELDMHNWNNEDPIVEDPVDEPFEVTPSGEDRPVVY